jgi:hypothetical protein
VCEDGADLVDGGFPFTCILSAADDKTGMLATRGFFGKTFSTGRKCIVVDCPAPPPVVEAPVVAASAPVKGSKGIVISFGKGRKLQTLGKGISFSMPAPKPTASCFKVCQPKPKVISYSKSFPVISFGKGK